MYLFIYIVAFSLSLQETFTNLFEAYNSSDGKAVIPSWLDQFLDIFKESNSSVTDAHIAVLGNKVDMSGKVLYMYLYSRYVVIDSHDII